MRIAKFKIENYKSFRSTNEIPLAPGFNVIVGQNNVGKTALVEALSTRFGPNPHRSLETVPYRNAPISNASTVTLVIELSRDELLGYMRRLGSFFVRLDDVVEPATVSANLTRAIAETNALRVVWTNSTPVTGQLIGLPLGTTPHGNHIQLRTGPDDAFEFVGGMQGQPEQNRFEADVGRLASAEQIYLFNAERFRLSRSPTGPNTILRPDASNLPEVLANLQGRNPARFNALCDDVQTIFPVVKRVSVRPVENNAVEILLWTIDPSTQRDDLAVTLAESGTGIAQALAILYVVLTADTPQVILIDEPQSFLHPGAVRKLIEILKQHPQHQFIITTHSPTAVTAADPDVLLLLSLREAKTVIERLDLSEAGHVRLFLAEIGARLSDVFGADDILWVEGRTEEECFPKILQRFDQALRGTAVIGVLQTGDFDGRRSKTIVEIYERLSRGTGLLPPAVGFIFDREGRSEADQEDLRRRSRGRVRFIPRRMYENYLLHPAAIAAVASAIEGFPELTDGEVSEWLELHRWDAPYFENVPSERTPEVWFREVRGGRILQELFKQLSGQRVTYDKVGHGIALTEWLLKNVPNELRQVGDLIKQALSSAAS